MSLRSASPSDIYLSFYLSFLTLNLSPSGAINLDGIDGGDRGLCADRVKFRVVRANGPKIPAEEHFFCHPSIPNAYLKCVVGKPAESTKMFVRTEVLEERQLVCGVNGYFNTARKACMPHPLSDCASKFEQYPPTNEQRLCDSYRLSRPDSYNVVASLICHNTEKQAFVVCPLNTASAVVVPCANGTFFNQELGKCVGSESQSDCPLKWKEMEEENFLKAGELRKPCDNCECICKALLALKGKKVIYVSHPTVSTKFLICAPSGQVHEGDCPPKMHWNDDIGCCDKTAFRMPVGECDGTPTAPPKTTVAPTTLPPTTLAPTTLAPTTLAPTTLAPTTVAPTSLPPTTIPPTNCRVVLEHHPEKMNWISANRVCAANLGSLATIPDQRTQQIMRDKYGSTSKSERYWVGASDRNLEGNWQWVTGELFGFTNWYRNQPSMKQEEDCLSFNYFEKGAWSDEDCSLDKPFICQYLVCTK